MIVDTLRVRTAAGLLAFLTPLAAAAQTPAPRHLALLIGISEYARGITPSNEWWDLSSSADIAALRTLLVDRFGFEQSNITALTSRSQTTRDAILSAFGRLAADTRKGDVVYIHYSGHGTPVIDRDGDEIDGLDESIVPSDYVSRRDGSRNITDDEIGAAIAKIKARGPASITLTFDSCFSGTQTRGGRMVVRGGNFLERTPPPRTGSDPDVTGLGGREAFAEGYVAISAARPDQVSTETSDESGGSMGLLTYALVRQMQAAGPDTTYRELFDGLLDTMTARNPGQVPQIEGDIDKVLMSGVARPPQPYLETRVDDGRVILQAGSLHGITAGSEFALYPGTTRTFAGMAPLAKATVTTVRATTAILTPTEPIDAEHLRLARAVETAHKFGDSTVRVDVSEVGRLNDGADLLAALERFAAERQIVRLTRGGEWDLKICGPACSEEVRSTAPGARSRGTDASALLLIRHDGSRAASLTGADLSAVVLRAVEAEARWRMVATLERRDPRIQVDVRLVPVDVTRDSAGNVVGATPRSSPLRVVGGVPVIEIGDSFMVELRNRGSLDAFVTVLDLSPDGSINPIWPHPGVGANAQENRLRAAPKADAPAWVRVPFPYVFQVGPPAGREIIKLIATDLPTDFSPLLMTAARSPSAVRGDQSGEAAPIGRLLASAARGTRGASLATEPPDPTVWSTAGFTFMISEPDAGEVKR